MPSEDNKAARRRWRRGLLLVGVALVFLSALWLVIRAGWPRASIVNRQSFDQIKNGMTEAEVIALFGVPPGDYASGTSMYTLVGRVAVPEEVRSSDWTSDEAAIEIAFDRNGRVVSKLFNAGSHMPTPGLLDRFRALLRRIGL
jgi:hypothetical protein